MPQPMIQSGIAGGTIKELERIFNSHKHILESYTNLKIPKHVLKQMARELEEFYNKNQSPSQSAIIS